MSAKLVADRLASVWRESPDTRRHITDRYPGLAHAIEGVVAPPEPVIAPGTTGRATVDGVGDIPVLRCERSDGRQFWATAYSVSTLDGGARTHMPEDEQVTDFVPDAEAVR